MTLTAQDVAEITRLLEESQFDELQLEHEGFKLTLRRSAAARPPAPENVPAPAVAPLASTPNPPDQQRRSVDDGALRSVPAPLLGTFYRAPKPGTAPYVELGAVVQEDSIIGIIEVMKLMNTVRAGVQGTVVEILAADGSLVEYGQVLLRISPASPP
jgi:acetyl-CoA carboxylase biotin carboxyl carrier protein